MKIRLISVLFVGLFAFLQSVPLIAWAEINQWTSIGPNGVLISDLSIAPSNSATLYAKTRDGGLLTSTNGGGSWGTINVTGLPSPYPHLLIDPSNRATLYAVSQGSGMFKSTDGGPSWNLLASTGLTDAYNSVNVLAIARSNPATLYVGTEFGAGVYKSTEGGASWSPTTNAPSRVAGIIIAPSDPATLYANTWYGLYRSTDGGASWSQADQGLNSIIQDIAIDPSNPATLYVITKKDYWINNYGVPNQTRLYELFNSTDGGRSWNRLRGSNTATYDSLAVVSGNPVTLYVATGVGIIKSIDGGVNVSLAGTGLTNVKVSGLVTEPSNPDTLYALTADGGLFKFTSVDHPNLPPTDTTVTLTASPAAVNYQNSTALNWSSNNASYCSATTSDGWSGEVALSGNISIIPNATTTYTLSCTGNAGSSSQSVTVTVNSPADCLFNWAEANYPGLFSPAGAVTLNSSPYTYRYYKDTNSYVGVSSSNNHVYYLSPDNVLQDVGGLPGWLATAGCQ